MLIYIFFLRKPIRYYLSSRYKYFEAIFADEGWRGESDQPKEGRRLLWWELKRELVKNGGTYGMNEGRPWKVDIVLRGLDKGSGALHLATLPVVYIVQVETKAPFPLPLKPAPPLGDSLRAKDVQGKIQIRYFNLLGSLYGAPVTIPAPENI
jgi:hypothetical protein